LSARFSPDGMYYWDGVAWVTTLSPDGRYRWDGSAWVPLAGWAPSAYAPPAAPVVRQPTSWTRPLQYAVAGWYAISALVSLSLPFWLGGQMSQMMRAIVAQQQAQNPDVQPPPPGFYDTMTSMMTGMLWVAAFVGFAIAVVVIIGALQRWTWLYYVVLVLLGLSVVSGPANLLSFVTGSTASTYGYSLPAWLYVVGIVSWFPSTALFVVMLIALVKRGPWGMTRINAGGSPAA
jgi:hypothetical protein